MAVQIDPTVAVHRKKEVASGEPMADRLAAIEQRIYDLCTAVNKIKAVVVAGTTATTNIAVADITVRAHVCYALDLTNDAMLENPAPTSAGQIQFPTANTTGKTVLVVYLDLP